MFGESLQTQTSYSKPYLILEDYMWSSSWYTYRTETFFTLRISHDLTCTNIILLTPIRRVQSFCTNFVKLTNVKQHYIQISCTDFPSNWRINQEIMDRNLCMLLSKFQPSLHQFSLNSQLVSAVLWTYPILNFVQINVQNVGKIKYTGCPRRNVPDFGRVFLMSKYTDITQNTYVQS